MSLQEILWFIPIASFTLAAILMRKAAPFQRTAGDVTVKEAAVAEERARQLLREGVEFGLDDATSATNTTPTTALAVLTTVLERDDIK